MKAKKSYPEEIDSVKKVKVRPFIFSIFHFEGQPRP